MNFLNIYDVLVYYFKKDIAKMIFSFIYEMGYIELFEYIGKKIIDNELYYYFKYLNLQEIIYTKIRKKQKKLMYGEFEFIDNTIFYYYNSPSDIPTHFKYKQYINDIIEKESKNSKWYLNSVIEIESKCNNYNYITHTETESKNDKILE